MNARAELVRWGQNDGTAVALIMPGGEPFVSIWAPTPAEAERLLRRGLGWEPWSPWQDTGRRPHSPHAWAAKTTDEILRRLISAQW